MVNTWFQYKRQPGWSTEAVLVDFPLYIPLYPALVCSGNKGTVKLPTNTSLLLLSTVWKCSTHGHIVSLELKSLVGLVSRLGSSSTLYTGQSLGQNFDLLTSYMAFSESGTAMTAATCFEYCSTSWHHQNVTFAGAFITILWCCDIFRSMVSSLL